ncbi:DUF4870 domain-containing protein [Alcanivorax sp.]|uniref:DUF4870 domain-containing protein n=1 Tax=Alcanivorax sp. TaxID=1872427 RepID=UPI000C673305|nr:DUF4870 domain-containing protein [Alcanivorax sp.]MBQ23795.1 orotate phosphoribosyltransferase [Alcanivorax sp.]|tara:strand:+ start:511 stop:879 length:369 start_codon:yes stop_codon:yes gene_type:complete
MSEENNSNGLAKQEERSLGLACHLLAFVGMVFPFGNILGPLVIWLVKKDDSAFVDDQGKEALNFNITISIAGFVAFLLTFVVIGAILLPIIGIFWLVMTIVAAVKANGGEYYRYPLTIRLIK